MSDFQLQRLGIVMKPEPGNALEAEGVLLLAPFAGRVRIIDNRKIAKLAKLSGAPETKAAGVELHVRLDGTVSAGESLCTLHADTSGALRYALDYASANPDIIAIDQG